MTWILWIRPLPILAISASTLFLSISTSAAYKSAHTSTPSTLRQSRANSPRIWQAWQCIPRTASSHAPSPWLDSTAGSQWIHHARQRRPEPHRHTVAARQLALRSRRPQFTCTSRANAAARSSPSLTPSPNSPPPWILRYRDFASHRSVSAFTPWAQRVDSAELRLISTS